MKLNALLLCRNQQSLAVLKGELEELGIAGTVCESAAETMGLLAQNHQSALVLDFDLPGALQVARVARTLSAERKPVIFAMIGTMTPVGGAIQAGVNFVLYKPLHADQVAHSLRAGQGFMRADRRRGPRHKAEGLVYLQFGVSAMPALVLDVSEQGLALQAPEPLPPVKKVPLRFALPGTGHIVEATGEVIWSDDGGRAGVFFSRLNAASRRNLRSWLAKRGANPKEAVRVLLQPQKLRHSVLQAQSAD
jgi:ActR/RegA family two-component response regulator